MRFSLALPTDRVDRPDEFGTGTAVMEMAAAAEAAGFDAVFVTEHPIPGDDWLASGGHHALDPFVALSFAAAATTVLRLQTNLAVVPYRNPYLLAKTVATLDALSGGRVILGAGAGYLEPEFAALGVPYDDRNERFDEALAVMKDVWSGASVQRDGPWFPAPGNTALPVPRQQPHPPIWIGGNSRRAIERAVEHGDGWMPMPNPARAASRVRSPALESLDDLAARVQLARDHMQRTGRSRTLDIMFMPITTGIYGQDSFDRGQFLREVDAQTAIGVTQMAVGFAPHGHQRTTALTSRAQFLDLTARFGKDIIDR